MRNPSACILAESGRRDFSPQNVVKVGQTPSQGQKSSPSEHISTRRHISPYIYFRPTNTLKNNSRAAEKFPREYSRNILRGLGNIPGNKKCRLYPTLLIKNDPKELNRRSWKGPGSLVSKVCWQAGKMTRKQLEYIGILACQPTKSTKVGKKNSKQLCAVTSRPTNSN